MDDSFHTHPKVLAIPRRARVATVGLWTLTGNWCSHHLTDGHLAAHMPAEFDAGKNAANLLIEVNLWERTASGFVFHDWADWQPTRAQVEADREAAKTRMAKVRQQRGSPNVRPNEQRTSAAVTPNERRSS